ncbi:MAG: GNAT family N-acetyltransferase [Deltaproteobacteria bacterium]|nr:GNAT family N-acetyltransferase [Deltaproteobacteria bacterium]
MSRCQLRDIALDHVPFVQTYAADRLISDTTASIPHPYPIDAAEKFIQQAMHDRSAMKAFVHAVYVNDQFVGVASLFHVKWDILEAEIGYWIGVPFWRRGYATQAVALLLLKAERLGLTALVGKCLARNPASRHVMEKVGFTFEKESIGCGQHAADAVFEFRKSVG